MVQIIVAQAVLQGDQQRSQQKDLFAYCLVYGPCVWGGGYSSGGSGACRGGGGGSGPGVCSGENSSTAAFRNSSSLVTRSNSASIAALRSASLTSRNRCFILRSLFDSAWIASPLCLGGRRSIRSLID